VNVSEIAINRRPELRRIAVTFPDRTRVMACGIRLYQELGIDCDLTDNTISMRVGRVAAPLYAGVLERLTGIPAQNDWDLA